MDEVRDYVRRIIPATSTSFVVPTASTLKTNLISFWELEEASGTRADAVVASGNNLTDNNTVTQQTGKVGFCGNFVRTNVEFLNHVDNASLNVAGTDFSIACWFYSDGTAGNPAIVSKRGGGGSIDYIIDTQSGPTIMFRIFSSDNNETDLLASAIYATLTWTFVAVTADFTNNLMKVYQDALTPTSSAIGRTITGGAGDFYMGANFGGDTWDGRIDQFGFWKKVLTASEVSQLYNSGNGLSYAAM